MATDQVVVPQLGRAHPDDPHRPGLRGDMEGEELEHWHRGKKPVLKKVKEKVKKMKGTIKKHGHGHAHDAHDHDTSEEDDFYEQEKNEGGGEKAVHPEVHGSATSTSSFLVSYGKKFDSSTPIVLDGGDHAAGEPPHGEPTVVAEHDSRTGGAVAAGGAERVGDSEKVPLKEAFGGLEEDPAAPKSATSEQLGGGEVVGDSPVMLSFQAMATPEQAGATASSVEKPNGTKEPNANRSSLERDANKSRFITQISQGLIK